MRWVHKIRVTMLCKEGDVQEEIQGAVREFAGVEPVAEPIEGSESVIVAAEVIKEAQQNELLKRLIAGLGSGTSTILEQVDSRVHEEEGDWNCYLRLDKEAYLKGRRMVLTDGGNCLHVRLTLAVYPKKRQVALDLARKLFASVVRKSI